MSAPELVLMVGQVGAGKTTRAKELAAALPAVRLTPDEWMRPLFGDPEADGMRTVVEGRLITTAVEILRAGASVVLDFGLWTRDERIALSWLAGTVGARARTEYLAIDPAQQAARVAERGRSDSTAWPVTQDALDEWRTLLEEPTPAEVAGDFGPQAAADWGDWIARKWPSALAEI
ncbi:AAA family ATPase [Brevibacterium sanguinis]|uniref:AAA family ATPase n=1 Tax=Brevibacterium sanguinis TaxID=232444 RepID=UPI0031CF47E2